MFLCAECLQQFDGNEGQYVGEDWLCQDCQWDVPEFDHMVVDVIDLTSGNIERFDPAPLDAAVLPEARVLNAGMDVLEDRGNVAIGILQKALHMGSRRYAELRQWYDKWNMKEWTK